MEPKTETIQESEAERLKLLLDQVNCERTKVRKGSIAPQGWCFFIFTIKKDKRKLGLSQKIKASNLTDEGIEEYIFEMKKLVLKNARLLNN
jgi:hypothetical protein